MSQVDLHLHLLPGVDDGARTEDEAVAHARRMVAAGIREATVTPHVGATWPVEVASIARRTAALAARLDREGVELRLHAGGELHPERVDSLTEADLAAVAHGPPGARWVLLEVPFAGIGEPFVTSLERLRSRGYGALVGHPERADGGLKRLWPQLARGTVLQVNAASLTGGHGPEARERGEWLMRNGLAFVLGSDGHPGTRDQLLSDGADAAARLGLSSVAIWRLTETNPRFLLRDGLPRVPMTVPEVGLEPTLDRF